jgi:AbrB family looped-hinge helix DNA binding protein
MQTTLDSEGQVMIPQSIRGALGLGSGTRVTLSVNSQGEVVVTKTLLSMPPGNRFESARGKADVAWRSDELMALLRGEYCRWLWLDWAAMTTMANRVGGGVMADENKNLEYEQWFLAQVALGLAEADDLATVWVSDDEAGASLAAKCAEWQARAVWGAA